MRSHKLPYSTLLLTLTHIYMQTQFSTYKNDDETLDSTTVYRFKEKGHC